MKKWISALLTVSMSVMLFGSFFNSANALEVTEVDSITLKQSPYQVEGWTFDNSYAISAPTSLAKTKNGYIAVGNYGTVMSSKDGKTWSALTRFANYQLTGVASNGENYVLAGSNVEYDNQAIYTPAELFVSNDGVTWKEVSFNFDDSIQYIEWGNSAYLASGRKGLYRSEDGKSWTKVIAHGEDVYQYHPLYYVNDTFFLYVYEKNEVLTSNDGKKWKTNKLDQQANIQSFIWFNNQYVGVGSEGIYKSTDGVKWSKLSSSPQQVWFKSITTDGKQVVAMGIGGTEDSQLVYTSKSLTSWSKQSLKHLNHQYFAIYPVADGFAGVGFSENTSIYSMYSKDGLNWSDKLIGSNVTGEFSALATNGKRVVAVGALGQIVYSDNGSKWHSSNTVASNNGYKPYFNDVEYGANKFVSATNNGIYTSKDGLSWSQVTYFKNKDISLSELIWTGQYFIAAGQVTGTYYSKDGVNWSKVSTLSGDDKWVMSMVYDGKRVIAGVQIYNKGNQYIQLYQTTNGTTWSKLGRFDMISIELAYNGEQYLAVDPYNINSLFVSKDAKNWSKVNATVAKDDLFYTIKAFDGYFVAFNLSLVVENGEYQKRTNYYTSKDGKTWKKHEVPAKQVEHFFGDEQIKDGIKAFGKYIFVGSQGFIMSTADLQLEDPIYISVNGTQIKQTADQGKAYIANGVTYLPLRVIGEALQFEVIWNSQAKTVTFKNNTKTATFAEVQLKNGLSYVPLRKVSEQLGYAVNYQKDGQNINVTIESK